MGCEPGIVRRKRPLDEPDLALELIALCLGRDREKCILIMAILTTLKIN